MRKSILTILPFLLVFSCNSKSQTGTNNTASQIAFREGAEFYTKSLDFINDRTTFIKLNKQAIQKFELAYHYDTTNRNSWLWLSDCYYNVGEFQKAIYWCKKDINFARSDSILLGSRYEEIGLSLLNLGDIEQAKLNIQTAIGLYKRYDTGMGLLIERIKKVSDHIYNKENLNQIIKLKSMNIDSCQYSLIIYKYATEISQEYYKFRLPSDEILITTRRENCR